MEQRRSRFRTMEDYLDKGFALILADLLSIVTIASCLVCKVPQIKTIVNLQSAKGVIYL